MKEEEAQLRVVKALLTQVGREGGRKKGFDVLTATTIMYIQAPTLLPRLRMLALLDEGEGLDSEDVRRLKVRREGGKEGGREEGGKKGALRILTFFCLNYVHRPSTQPSWCGSTRGRWPRRLCKGEIDERQEVGRE